MTHNEELTKSRVDIMVKMQNIIYNMADKDYCSENWVVEYWLNGSTRYSSGYTLDEIIDIAKTTFGFEEYCEKFCEFVDSVL